jgi:predicted nucleic acid-binding protein
VNGWLLDTNVIAELAKSHGTARVQAWADAQDEALLFLSILTLGEYDKRLHNLPPDSPLRLPVVASVAAPEMRSAGRVLPLSDATVQRWGTVSGAVKRLTGQTPPTIGTLLAASAIEQDLCLATRNVRNLQHSGAMLLNPWDD